MQTQLSQKASWAEVLFFSTNNRLLEVIAEAIAQLGSYDEWLTRNTRWDLATEKSSLVTNAQFMQYDPDRKIGASGNIRCSTDSGYAAPPSKIVVYPKYTSFANAAGTITFVSTQTENQLTDDNYIDIPVIQGEAKSFTNIALGDDYEEISITNSSIENSIYDLYVNDVLWTEISDINDATTNQEVYTLKNKKNFDGIDIGFGNGIFGKKLTAGDTVIFKYVETLGISGNVTSTGIVIVVDDTIYDIDSDAVTVYCTNTDSLDGGTDEEDIEDIRTDGTKTFQAGDKAVVQGDYEVKLEQSSYIYKAVTWGAYEYNIDNDVDPWTFVPIQENVVNVSAFTPAGEQLSDAQKVLVIAGIVEEKPPTDILQFTDTVFIKLAWNIDLYVQDRSYVLSTVKSNIITAVSNRYDLSSLDFNQSIYETEWKGFINDYNDDDLSGVTHHDSYIEIIKSETLNTAYVGDLELEIFPIETESIRLYVKGSEHAAYTLMGTDDGAGEFTAESPFDLDGSSIVYATGAGALQVNAGLAGTYSDYEIKIYYQTSDNDIVPTARNQICKTEEITEVTAQYIEDN